MKRGFPVTVTMRAERRKAADDRQAEYDKLTLQQKLDKVPVDGGKKERAKLEAKIAAAANKATTLAKANEAVEKKKSTKGHDDTLLAQTKAKKLDT